MIILYSIMILPQVYTIIVILLIFFFYSRLLQSVQPSVLWSSPATTYRPFSGLVQQQHTVHSLVWSSKNTPAGNSFEGEPTTESVKNGSVTKVVMTPPPPTALVVHFFSSIYFNSKSPQTVELILPLQSMVSSLRIRFFSINNFSRMLGLEHEQIKIIQFVQYFFYFRLSSALPSSGPVQQPNISSVPVQQHNATGQFYLFWYESVDGQIFSSLGVSDIYEYQSTIG